MTDETELVHLWREDRRPCNPDWYELWRIKNQFVESGGTAIELFPAAANLMDGANERHLLIVPQEMVERLPCLKAGRGWHATIPTHSTRGPQ
jgi:hypothetical protein